MQYIAYKHGSRFVVHSSAIGYDESDADKNNNDNSDDLVHMQSNNSDSDSNVLSTKLWVIIVRLI